MHTEPSYKMHLREESAGLFSVVVLNHNPKDVSIHKSLPDHISYYS